MFTLPSCIHPLFLYSFSSFSYLFHHHRSLLFLPPYNQKSFMFLTEAFFLPSFPSFPLFVCPKVLKKGEKMQKIIILHSHLSSLMIFRGYSIVSLSRTQLPPVLLTFISSFSLLCHSKNPEVEWSQTTVGQANWYKVSRGIH